MTTDILEVLRLKRRVLRICVGSTDLPSPYLTSRPLRRVIYGLLLPEWDAGFPVEVAETERVGLKLEECLFTPHFKITNEDLPLDSMHKVSQRSDVVYSCGFTLIFFPLLACTCPAAAAATHTKNWSNTWSMHPQKSEIMKDNEIIMQFSTFRCIVSNRRCVTVISSWIT